MIESRPLRSKNKVETRTKADLVQRPHELKNAKLQTAHHINYHGGHHPLSEVYLIHTE